MRVIKMENEKEILNIIDKLKKEAKSTLTRGNRTVFTVEGSSIIIRVDVTDKSGHKAYKIGYKKYNRDELEYNILSRLSNGEKQYDIANIYGISQSTVSLIKKEYDIILRSFGGDINMARQCCKDIILKRLDEGENKWNIALDMHVTYGDINDIINDAPVISAKAIKNILLLFRHII